MLENHHLAAAFQVLFKGNDCNILASLPWDVFLEVRKMVIQVVLNSDQSKHFYLMTTLKTKLGVDNFPTDLFEDRELILSVTLRACDLFKVSRVERQCYKKWMDSLFDEFDK